MDGGVGAGTFARFDGVTEQVGEDRAGGVRQTGRLGGVADLPEDLALAEHGRVDARGDVEQVPDGGVVVTARHAAAELHDSSARLRAAFPAGWLGAPIRLTVFEAGPARRERPEAYREERLDVGDAVVEPVHGGVDLRAQACREDDDLGQVRARDELGQCLAHLVLADGCPLEDLERCVPFVHTDDYDRHVWLPLLKDA